MPNNSAGGAASASRQVEANFNPALGFVSRSDVRDTTADVGYTHFTRGGLLQTIFSGVDARAHRLPRWRAAVEVVLGRLVEMRTTTGERAVNVHYSAQRERS